MVSSPERAAYDAIMQEGTVSKAKRFISRIKDMAEEEVMRNLWDDVLNVLSNCKKSDFKQVAQRILYSVEIPDDNGTNYLHWEKPLTKEQQGLIYKLLRDEKIILDLATADFWNGKSKVWNSGSELYNFLNDCFRDHETGNDSQQQASKFLSRAGFTGISYPAQYLSGGRKDGARNYVIFNESDAKIVDKVRFFRTANGEAYGFTVDGKVYLDPKIAGAETAIHEYTHLWATALKNANPKEWSNIVSLMKGTPLWDKVASEYPELTTDDELADEVLAHYSGKRGAERLRKEAESIANGKGSLLDKAGAISALERVKEALTRFWKATADLLHIHFTTAEEVADKVLADLLNGVNPNEVAKDKNTRFQLIGEQGAEALDKAEEATIRLDNLQVAKEMEAEKKDAKTVKLATGWERGADGKWRYEIMDGNFDPTGEMHPERRKLSQDEQKELDEAFFEIMNAFEKGALAYNEEIDESTDMADIYVAGGMERKKAERMAFLEEKERNLSKQPKHIDDYLSNKQLFDAYPELKDIVVVEGDGDFVFTGKLGSYNPTTNTLTLNDISQDVLIHEVQHVIQRIEGFAKGGNPNTPELKDNREYKKWKEQLDRMRSVSERETNLYKELQYFSDEAEKLDKIIEEMSNGLKTADEMSAIEEKKKELFEIEKSITVIINELEEERTKRGKKVSAMLGAEKSVLQRLYNNLSGEVEARNAQKRMKMTAEERRASLAEETEDVARKDQIFILDNLGESHMGTKVDKRMENIGEHYKGKKLSNEQKAVIDVFSGNKDNQPLSVTRADGKRTIVMRQGTENKAGTKHSLFRHYETNSGVITAEDIALIPQIVQKGDLKEVKGGKGFEYVFEKDGVRYKVYTEFNSKSKKEEFCDFYSNKKPQGANSSISNRDALNGNTQSSARITSPQVSDAKVIQSSDNPSIDEENLFRKPVGGNSGYVGYSMSKRAEQAREEESTSGEDLEEVNARDLPISERAKRIKELHPIEVKRNNFNKENLKNIYNNLPSVNKDGYDIEFYHSAFNKIYKEDGIFGQVIPSLDKILKESLFAYSEKDNLGGQKRPDGTIHKAHPNVQSFDNYVGKVRIEDKDYYLRFTVQQSEKNSSGTHSFMVTEVDLYEKTANGLSLPITTRARLTKDGIIDTKLQQFFKEAKLDETKDENLYREVTDKSELEWLNKQPTIKTYRAMQVVNKTLYSPMASGKKKFLGQGYGLNSWDVATEMVFNITDEIMEAVEKLNQSNEKGYVEVIPNKLRFTKSSKSGKAHLQFHLITDETDVWAAYNPYNHNSNSMLNDQFKAAYRRGNLVVVEAEVPIADLNSKYHAPYAKDSVGKTKWKSGNIASQFPKNMERIVYLSRYTKPVRILSNTEVAKWIADRLRKAEKLTGKPIVLYEDSFHPEVKKILEAEDFEFIPVKQPKSNNSKILKGHPDYMDDAKIAELNKKMQENENWLQQGIRDSEEIEAKQSSSAIADSVRSLAERLHLDNVEIVNDTSALSGKEAKAKGFYSKSTGKITIVIPNNTSAEDAVQTLLHEAVAHYGLRQLFGGEFDNFLDAVLENADKEVLERIYDLAQANGWDYRKASKVSAMDALLRDALAYVMRVSGI